MLGYTDVLIIAKPQGSLPPLSDILFHTTPVNHELNRLRIPTALFLQMRLLGDKAFFAPYLESLAHPENSDYYPVVDQYASAARFKLHTSEGFTNKTHLFQLLAENQPLSLDRIVTSTAARRQPTTVPLLI